MELMELITGTLLSKDGVKNVAKSAGTKVTETEKVMKAAIPALLEGMQQNASTKTGAKSLATALDSHAASSKSDILSLLSNIDLDDGSKILSHILGDNKTKLSNKLSKATGVTKSSVSNILSSLAPALLSLLGYKKQDSNTSSSGLADLLGSFFGSGSSGSSNLGNVAGNILSSLLSGKDDDDDKDDKDDNSGNIVNSLLGLFS